MDVIRVIVYASIFIGLFTMAFYLLGFIGKKRVSKEITRYPHVSILIPAYNEEETLVKTVDSAAGLNYPKDKLEIMIIDDGSKDKTFQLAKQLEKKYSNVKAFRKNNGGKASAMNFGIARAKGEMVISFDADSMVVPDALRKMIPYFDDPKVMCVTPALKVWKPKGILQRVQAIEYDMGLFLRKAFSNLNSVHVTPGPFSAYRKKFFEEYGGYDEKNITEDMEVAMRIQSTNKYKIENCIEAVVYTIAPNKLGALTKQRRRWYFGMVKNLLQYRRMFSREYGELGILIFPMAVISILTTMVVTFYYMFRTISELITQAGYYSLIGFDFANNVHFRPYTLGLSLYQTLSEGVIVFGVFFGIYTIAMLLIVNRKAKTVDKPLSTFISYVIFMFLYGILFSVWWLISIIYSITKKNIDW